MAAPVSMFALPDLFAPVASGPSSAPAASGRSDVSGAPEAGPTRFGAAPGDGTTPAMALTGWRTDQTRRLRVLLHTVPLLDLHAGDGRVVDLRHYDSLAVTLRIFDVILEAMGTEVGVDAASLTGALQPLATAMDRRACLAPDAERHRALVDRILGCLLNDGARRQKFEGTYVDIGPDGEAEEVVFHYRLLEEVHRDGDGAIVLRLTNEAINIYLGALDQDIEDAQVAAEAVIREQIQRGSFAKAVQMARDARLQSMRYVEKLQRILELTRRNVRQVDWVDDVPAMLTAAGAHLQRRLVEERTILGAVDEQLSVLRPGSEEARQVATIKQLVQQCWRQHSDLSARLVGARQIFLDEQGRQGFAEAVRGDRPSFPTDVLDPMMALPVREAVQVGDAALVAIAGAVAPPLLSLDALIGWMLRPRREVAVQGVAVAEREMATLPEELQRFPGPIRAAAERYLLGVASPTSAADLLATAETEVTDLAILECLALRVFQIYGAESNDATPVVVARGDGEFEIAGLRGHNLRIVPRAAPGP